MANKPDGTALTGAVIVFDLDGTLVDTAPDLTAALNAVLADQGLNPLPFDEARGLIGQGARRMLERGFAAAGAPKAGPELDVQFTQFLVRYEACIADASRPYPGVAAALSELKDRGARLAVCTNKLTGLSTALLGALGLSPLFDAVVGPDIAGAAKPDARHLKAAVEAAGGTADRAVMVGDASPDAAAARAAGIPLILVSFGYTDTPAAELSPDVLIDSFEALPEACLRLLGACEA